MRLTNLVHVLLFLIFSIFCQANAFTMKITPIDSPHLRLMPQGLTMKERTQLRIDLSVSRAFYANKRNANLSPNSIRLQLSHVPGFYVTQVSVGMGDTAYSRYLVLDLFADQTWFQCAGCSPCFNVSGGDVQADNSSTYVRMTPNDVRCVPQLIYEGSCGFEHTYGPGHTVGYLGMDTFTFTDSKNQTQYFSNVAFGCGMKNTGFEWNTENPIAGIFGLSTGPRSFFDQLTQQIKNKFSYCVPSWDATGADAPSTTIAFGDDAKIIGDDARKVQQIAMNAQARYHLYLIGITVDGKRLPIDPTVWKLDGENYTSGFFIDPSVPFTVLNKEPYALVKDAMINYFSQYKLNQSAPGQGHDLCFPNTLDEDAGQTYPTMSFIFTKTLEGGGEVNLLLDQTNVFIPSKPGFCLAIEPLNDTAPSILGAYQQANWKFLFDAYNGQLSFVSDQTCKGDV